MGDGATKTAEMWNSGAEFLPPGSTVGGKAHREGNGDLGDGDMGHLERQEQVLLLGKTIPAKGHPSGCVHSLTGLSALEQRPG